MSRALGEFDELLFIESITTGAVHFFVVPWRLRDDDGPASSEAAKKAFAQPYVTVRCGLRTVPWAERRHRFTDRFADDRLCGGCYRTLRPVDQARAFEHEQPGGE